MSEYVCVLMIRQNVPLWGVRVPHFIDVNSLPRTPAGPRKICYVRLATSAPPNTELDFSAEGVIRKESELLVRHGIELQDMWLKNSLKNIQEYTLQCSIGKSEESVRTAATARLNRRDSENPFEEERVDVEVEGLALRRESKTEIGSLLLLTKLLWLACLDCK
ncbi:hypothetical protein Tco_0688392 [Tanacetum coccineum]